MNSNVSFHFGLMSLFMWRVRFLDSGVVGMDSST